MNRSLQMSCRVALALTAIAAAIAQAGETKPAASKVVQVVLYRGQALVTRLVPIAGSKGGGEIVVADLPEQIVSDSLFAEGNEGVEIRAVRFRSRAVGEEPREEVQQLVDAIADATSRLELNQKLQQAVAKQSAYLDAMESFALPTAKTDLARGFLDATTLEKITRFAFEQRDAIAGRSVELDKEGKDIQKELELLQRKLGELTRGAKKAVREAVLFYEKSGNNPESVRLNYLVSNCGWSPVYSFQAGKDAKEVEMECSGLIHQMTGEDWTDVKLTLSTASPALSASGPGLGPFQVSLVPVGQAGKFAEKDVAAQVESIRDRQSAAIAQTRNAMRLEETISSSWSANLAANDFQVLELAVGKDVLRSAASRRDGEGPSLSYRLTNPVSLPTRSDQQMVRILKSKLPSTFYYEAVPVLTSYVYRNADVLNNGADDLLGGPINVYLDGRFVGRSEIPTVARGQTFVVGFGADPQVRAQRELVNRTDVVQGGNRELGFKYRLVIENFKSEPISLRVSDRIPYTDRPNEVRITLGTTSDKLSADEIYLRTERPKNILRWDIKVPAGATGEKSQMIEYEYTVAFDRQLTINLPGTSPTGSPAAVPAEFDRMQRAKGAK